MRLIVLSGPIGVGKTTFGDALVSLFGAARVSTRRWLIANTGCENERGPLQEAGASQDAATGGAWVVKVVEDAIALEPCELLLMDAARIPGQVQALRKRYGGTCQRQ